MSNEMIKLHNNLFTTMRTTFEMKSVNLWTVQCYVSLTWWQTEPAYVPSGFQQTLLANRPIISCKIQSKYTDQTGERRSPIDLSKNNTCRTKHVHINTVMVRITIGGKMYFDVYLNLYSLSQSVPCSGLKVGKL